MAKVLESKREDIEFSESFIMSGESDFADKGFGQET